MSLNDVGVPAEVHNSRLEKSQRTVCPEMRVCEQLKPRPTSFLALTGEPKCQYNLNFANSVFFGSFPLLINSVF